MTVWNSLGQAIPCTVKYANHWWIDLTDSEGNKYVVPTPQTA